MTKLPLVLFVVFIVGFGLLDTVKTEEPPEESSDDDRSGAYAHASISVRPSSGPRPGPPGPPGPQPGLVQCYTCVDCPQVLPDTATKWCPRTLDPSKQSSCVSYAEQYNHLKRAWHIRGCATERGSCADIKQAHSSHSDVVKLLSCHECEGDRCNGASRSITDLTMAVFALLISPLVAKITLS